MQISNHISDAIFRVDEAAEAQPELGRELALVRTKLQEAEQWLTLVAPEVAAKIQAREADRRARIAAKRNR